jgi:IS30 family transposase
MSFQEDCVRFGDQLARLVDAGVPMKEAAVVVGLPRQRCYAILRAVGRPAGRPRGRGGIADPSVIVAVFDRTGSISAAAKACEVAHSVARRILVEQALVSRDKQVPGKPDAKRRCLELIAPGWSTTRAAREVGVNERTARDGREGIRHSNNPRIYPDGWVVDYNHATVY